MDFAPVVLVLEISHTSRIDRERRRASRFYKKKSALKLVG
jgi:hypothetical protein